jgi:RNA polymerase sigma-70 factor (ECF subfamily)
VKTSGPTPRATRETRFRAVYEATYDDLLRFAQRRTDPSAAEDVTAEVFLVAWRRLEDVPDAIDDARPWLFGVARATMLNHRRGERRRDALAVRLADAAVPDGSSAHEELAVARLDVAAAWTRLTPAEQEVIALAVWEGLDSARAGVVLGCSATAYRLRLSRARRALRRHLEATTGSTDLDGLPTRPSATTPPGHQR